MTDIIQLLPDSVANQIAAGEVIQRPASVVKELVENAVDAGARLVQVLITDAGRTAIQVVDDGCGMSETDARLAFERHATSKIRQADDLFALRTMGFRGEALPSIAAVAQVQLTTRMAADEIGTRLTLQGSRLLSQEPAACPVGSNFRVDNLFFNVPARRKFLKSNATELNNILTAFERIVLVYPDIAFTLHSNGQELLNLRPGTLRQRISDVFGRKLSQDLLPVEVTTAVCRITGFVGKPEAARKKGGHDYFFVNGRFMRHPYFHKAVCGAFERLVPAGMSVPYFIYFEVEPADIDVNIHPTKTEIKFENEQPIWQILSAAVKDAVGRFCEVPAIDFDTEARPDIPLFDPSREAEAQMPRVDFNPSYNPFVPSRKPAARPAFADSPRPSRPLFPDQPDVPGDPVMTGGDADEAAALLSEKSPVHYQYKGRYIMTAVKSGLMIIDQQRADIRIRYDRYLSQLARHVASTQRMLFPEVVEFSPSDAVLMQRFLPDLQAIGFEVSDLGGGSFAVSGLPAGLEGLQPAVLLHALVAEAADRGTADATALHQTLALSLARHAAIPVGQVLSNDEMERIVNDLFACSNVNYTPDGRAILCILPQTDIEQLLG